MNVHKNAFLTPKGREAMVRKFTDHGWPKSKIARHFLPSPYCCWAIFERLSPFCTVYFTSRSIGWFGFTGADELPLVTSEKSGRGPFGFGGFGMMTPGRGTSVGGHDIKRESGVTQNGSDALATTCYPAQSSR